MCCWSPVKPDIPILNYTIGKCCFFQKAGKNHKHYMVEEEFLFLSACLYLGGEQNKTKYPKW